jgi:hypothetical protein
MYCVVDWIQPTSILYVKGFSNCEYGTKEKCLITRKIVGFHGGDYEE